MSILGVLFIVISLFHKTFSIGITCKDEGGSSVDWFINYKLPKLEQYSRNTPLGSGTAYSYLLQNSNNWILSTVPVATQTSMLGQTFNDFYKMKQSLTYLLYNDQSPYSGSTVGHTKGAVVFGNGTGFWLIHSIPKFPHDISYRYPKSGNENGQSIFCITFGVSYLNEIGKQLLFNAPNIYSENLNQEEANGLDEDVKSLFSDKPKFIRKSPFKRVAQLTSLGGTKITSFAKDNQFKDDLYSAIIAPELQSSLYVETWRRGSGGKLKPACQTDYQVIDIKSISMTVLPTKEAQSIMFSSTEDHSKWAVAENSKFVCIGDINRMKSQYKRGGGAACISSDSVGQAFKTSIEDTDDCPI